MAEHPAVMIVDGQDVSVAEKMKDAPLCVDKDNKTELCETQFRLDMEAIRLGQHPRLLTHQTYLEQIRVLREYCNEAWKTYQLSIIEKCYGNEMAALQSDIEQKKILLKEKLLNELLARKRKYLEEKDLDAERSLVSGTLDDLASVSTKTKGTHATGPTGTATSTRKTRTKRAAASNIDAVSSLTDPLLSGTLLTRHRAAAIGVSVDSNGTAPNQPFLAHGQALSMASLSMPYALLSGGNLVNGTIAGPNIQESLKEADIEQDLDVLREIRGVQGHATRRALKSLKASQNEEL